VPRVDFAAEDFKHPEITKRHAFKQNFLVT